MTTIKPRVLPFGQMSKREGAWTRKCKICGEFKKTTDGCTQGYKPTWFICAECNKKPITKPMTLKVTP